MAINTVRAQINGIWHTLTKNTSTGKWEATITAPGATSFNLSGGYYNVTVEATNTAGTTGTANGDTVTGLRLVVKETIAPVITMLSPSSGAYVSNNKQPVVFTVTDESGGSGVNPSSVVVKRDGTQISSSELTRTAITNGYSFTYTPASALSDGAHTIQVSASDNDGNAATAKSTTFTVDTVPPTLNVTAPADGLITAATALIVKGTTNDITSSPVTLTIKLNGSDQGSVTVSSDGSWSKTVQLAEGSNTLIVTATDAAGKVTSVTRTVTLDTSIPKITAATISPNPANTGASVIISVTVTEG